MPSVKKPLSIVLIVCFGIHLVAGGAMAQDSSNPTEGKVYIAGKPVFGSRAQVGLATGTVLKTDAVGVYVKVLKADVRDPETESIVERFKKSEWDLESWLLLVPLASIAGSDSLRTVGSADSVNVTQLTDFQCYLEGKQAAKQSSTTGSFVGGLCGGLFLGVLGMAMAVVAQNEPSVPYRYYKDERFSAQGVCGNAFTVGYQEEGKSKKRSAALAGGVLGSLTLFLVVVVISASN
jgi:hypothetical protein